MKRTVFAYPYVVFAIIFLLAPLVLIFIYSITQPINPISLAPRQEILLEDFVENLISIGYKEDNTISVPGTYFAEGESVVIYNNRLNRDEFYHIYFNDEGIEKQNEIYKNGEILDENLSSLRIETVINGFTFTLNHFITFFKSPVYMTVLLRSIYIAFVSTFFCILIGYPTAYVLSKMKNRSRSFMSMIFILPMWMNFLLRTYAWRTILENNGILNQILNFFGLPSQNMMYSKDAVILCMVYNFLPFMIMPIYNALCKIDKSLIEASQDLGANNYVSLFKIVLPLSFPGVASGITMTFIPSVTTFAISRILGGTESAMIGEIIEREFNYNYWFGSAISVIIMAMLLISMTFLSKYDKEENVGGGLI